MCGKVTPSRENRVNKGKKAGKQGVCGEMSIGK